MKRDRYIHKKYIRLARETAVCCANYYRVGEEERVQPEVGEEKRGGDWEWGEASVCYLEFIRQLRILNAYFVFYIEENLL